MGDVLVRLVDLQLPLGPELCDLGCRHARTHAARGVQQPAARAAVTRAAVMHRCQPRMCSREGRRELRVQTLASMACAQPGRTSSTWPPSPRVRKICQRMQTLLKHASALWSMCACVCVSCVAKGGAASSQLAASSSRQIQH